MESIDVKFEQELVEFMQDKNESDLIEVLHKVQKHFNYIPKEIITLVSKELRVPVSKIYGVATFYTTFSLDPKGKYAVSICTGTACYVRGANKLVEEIEEYLEIGSGETTEDGLFSIVETRCIGACGLAPLVTVNDDVHGRLKEGMMKDILEEYKLAEYKAQHESAE